MNTLENDVILNNNNNNNELEIQSITSEDSEVIVDDFDNILYNNINSHIELDKYKKNIYNLFGRVFVFTTKNKDNMTQAFPIHIFSKNITMDLVHINSIRETFTIIEASNTMLYNSEHYNNARLINGNTLSTIFPDMYSYNRHEIIVYMIDKTEDDIKRYVKLYGDTFFNVGTLCSIVKTTKEFNSENIKVVMSNMKHNLMNMKDTFYWSVKKNTIVSYSKYFAMKTFEYSRKNANIRKIVKMNITNSNNSAYTLGEKLNTCYIDGSTEVLKQKNYYILRDCKYNVNKDDVTNMFINMSNMKSSKMMTYMFNTFLILKDYSHFVLNNKKVLEIMKPNIDKYKLLYKYLIGYTWSSYYLEECLLKIYVKKTNRIVFDMDTARMLPMFPCSQDDPLQNPYVAMFLSKNDIDGLGNCTSIGPVMNYKDFKIDTLDNFRKKFNIFTTGRIDKNIFDGLDWANFGISGSLVQSSILEKPQLFDIVTNKQDSFEKQWNDYFNEYYNSSDIDIMVKYCSWIDFLSYAKYLGSVLEKNINSKIKYDFVKLPIVMITETFLKDKMLEIASRANLNSIDIQEAINLINDNPNVKEYIYGIYCDAKKKSNANTSTKYNSFYDEFYRVSPIESMRIEFVQNENLKKRNGDDIFIKMVDLSTDKKNMYIDDIGIVIAESIRVKMSSDNMKRTVEFFKSSSDDFFAPVARFHFPCVRSYYDGTNVYMLPSCYTANTTGYNIDYKYFAGVRDPIEIIHKYRSRGQSILLSKKEKEHMLHYIINNKEMKKIYKLEDKENIKSARQKIFGYVDVNSDLYKVKYLANQKEHDKYNNVEYVPIKNIDELKQVYVKEECIIPTDVDMFKIKTIDDEGNITVLKKWVIDMFDNID